MSKISYEKVNITQEVNAIITYVDESVLKENGVTGKQYYTPQHWHRSIEFSLVCKGKVNLWINNHKTTVKEGEFIFVNSGQVHKVDCSNQEEFGVLIVIISYEFLKNAIHNIDNLFFDITKESPKKKRIYEIYEFFKLFSKKPNLNDELLINSYLYEILYILVNEFKVDLSNNEREHIIYRKREHEILNYIEENYKENLTLKSLAEKYYMSQEHFSRVFYKNFGINFKTYLKNYRLYCSYEDIVNSKKTIQDIAFEHGFLNVKSLISAFKDSYSVTPYQYRKLYNKSNNRNLLIK